jgi:tetratricopeptide (TPR) repeat protein
MTRGDFAEAERLYRDAIPLEQKWGTLPNALLLMSNLAGVLDRQGKMAETKELLLQRIRAAETHWPDGHWQVGAAHGALGRWYVRAGDATTAEPLLRTALGMYRSTFGEDHNTTATGKLDLARCLMENAQYSEAEGLLTSAADWLQANRESENRLTQAVLSKLAELYEAWGRPGQDSSNSSSSSNSSGGIAFM